MTQYDVTVITEQKEALAKVADLVSAKGATIVSRSEMGERQFAYPINKQKSGFYGSFVIDIDEPKLPELGNALNLSPLVMRSLIVRFVPVTTPVETFEPKPIAAVPATENLVMQSMPKEELPVSAKPTMTQPVAAEEPKQAVVAVKEKKAKAPKKVDAVSEKERLKMLDEKLKKLLEE